MSRSLLAALAAGVAGSLAAAQLPKPKDPTPTGESQAVLEVLGLAAVPGLPLKLAEEYRPDLVTEGDVRKDLETRPGLRWEPTVIEARKKLKKK